MYYGAGQDGKSENPNGETTMNKKILLLAGAMLFIAGCQSTPDVPVAAGPVAETAPPSPTPVQSVPQASIPAPTIVENATPPPVQYSGPTPGTSADFLYQSGGEGRIFFGYDQYGLSTDARSSLSRQAQWLQNYPNVVAVIEGNADERGTREYNLALAARRAESVKSYLVSQGVSPSRLTTVSYGKERPIDGRSTEDGWARNRNAHTNLMSGTIG